MIPFRLQLRHKLTLITMLTSVAALVLACGAFLGYELYTFRKTMSQDLATLGDVIGDNTTAALTFGDSEAARGVLASLKAQKNVLSACVYDAQDKPFATYQRELTADAVWPERAHKDSYEHAPRWLGVFRPIELDHETIGTVYIRSDLREMQERIRRYVTIAGVVLLAAMLLAFLLSSLLQGMIASPILHLAAVTRDVGQSRDYSKRAVRTGDDEVGELIDGFNGMLSEIERSMPDTHVNSPVWRGRERTFAAVAAASAALAMRCQGSENFGLSAHVTMENRMPPCGPLRIAFSTSGSSSALAMPSICSL